MTLLTRIWIVLVGCVLLYTGTTKGLYIGGFERTPHMHEVLPPVLVPAVAWGVPAAEWIVGAIAVGAGVGGRYLWAGCIAVVAMFAGFSVYLGFLALIRGPEADCGCGLPAAGEGPLFAVARNAGLLSLPLGWLVVAALSPARAPAAA